MSTQYHDTVDGTRRGRPARGTTCRSEFDEGCSTSPRTRTGTSSRPGTPGFVSAHASESDADSMRRPVYRRPSPGSHPSSGSTQAAGWHRARSDSARTVASSTTRFDTRPHTRHRREGRSSGRANRPNARASHADTPVRLGVEIVVANPPLHHGGRVRWLEAPGHFQHDNTVTSTEFRVVPGTSVRRTSHPKNRLRDRPFDSGCGPAPTAARRT